jgi:bacterioferritin
MAKRLRDQSFEEMKDAEEIIDRVLYFDGLPNLQRFDAFMVGETVPEQLQLALEMEQEAVAQIGALMAACDEEGDTGTREFLAPKLLEEQTHISWIESQLTLVKQIGEANYLTQQVRE